VTRLAAVLLCLTLAARADVNLKRVVLLSPSAYSNPEGNYHPVADMDHNGLLEMAYVTGRAANSVQFSHYSAADQPTRESLYPLFAERRA